MAIYAGRYAVGCARAGLIIGADGVVIRNPLKTRTVALSDATCFTAAQQPAQHGNPTPGVVLEVNSGSVYPVWTFAREGLVWNSAKNTAAWQDVAQSLNELLRSAA